MGSYYKCIHGRNILTLSYILNLLKSLIMTAYINVLSWLAIASAAPQNWDTNWLGTNWLSVRPFQSLNSADSGVKNSPNNNDGKVCEGMTNGCSVPAAWLQYNNNNEYSKLFEKSCNRHDICYYCSENFGFQRNDC